MKVSKWGNSLAIRLTSEMISQLDVSEGDEVTIRASASLDGLTIRKKLGREELRQRVKAMRGIRPAGFKFDRDEFSEG